MPEKFLYNLEKAQEEAAEMQKKIEDSKAKDYSDAEKLVENEGEVKKEKEIMDAVMMKVQDINKNETAYTTIGIYQLSKKEKSILNLIKEGNLENIFCDGLLGDRGGPGDYKYGPKDNDKVVTKNRWAENARKFHKGVVHFNIVGRGSDVSRKRNKIAKSEWSLQDKIIMLFDLDAFKEEKPLAFRKYDEIYDLHPKTRTYLASEPDTKRLKKKDKKWIPRTDFGYILSHRVAPRFFRGIVANFVGLKKGQYHFDSLKYDEISKSWFGRKIEKKEIINQIVSTMKKVFGNKKFLYLPIYDIDGNLLWPKEISYKEIKENENI